MRYKLYGQVSHIGRYRSPRQVLSVRLTLFFLSLSSTCPPHLSHTHRIKAQLKLPPPQSPSPYPFCSLLTLRPCFTSCFTRTNYPRRTPNFYHSLLASSPNCEVYLNPGLIALFLGSFTIRPAHFPRNQPQPPPSPGLTLATRLGKEQ